ncbi:hypothetical protein GCM10023321_81130 [Pseudonocardia eucalypti]|uniref:Uncharacterized protein n=1 Tax=Pseudonocardia eucalypti TaxID=648755 RepID=A0ABP9RCU2_9PSEU
MVLEPVGDRVHLGQQGGQPHPLAEEVQALLAGRRCLPVHLVQRRAQRGEQRLDPQPQQRAEVIARTTHPLGQLGNPARVVGNDGHQPHGLQIPQGGPGPVPGSPLPKLVDQRPVIDLLGHLVAHVPDHRPHQPGPQRVVRSPGQLVGHAERGPPELE